MKITQNKNFFELLVVATHNIVFDGLYSAKTIILTIHNSLFNDLAAYISIKYHKKSTLQTAEYTNARDLATPPLHHI